MKLHIDSIRLDPHFEVRLKHKIGEVEIYERTLAGYIIDYCAVVGKDTYHADTKKLAMEGMTRKLSASRLYWKQIDKESAQTVGFCPTGIEQFCEDFGLDSSKSYTREEIQSVINSNKSKAEKYKQDLQNAGFNI